MPIAISRPSLGTEELCAVEAVFASGGRGLGTPTRAFEKALERYLGRKHVVVVHTGRSALHIVLSAFGIGPDGEVVGPSAWDGRAGAG